MLARTYSFVPVDGEGLGQRLGDALGDGHDLVVAVDVLAQHDELVASEAGRGVACSQDARAPLGDADEQLSPASWPSGR